jgi:hypothetical protein
VIRARRTIALLIIFCTALVGCSPGGGEPDPDSSGPAKPTGSVAAPTSTPSDGGFQRTDPRLNNLDLRNFEYLGGCGWDVPAAPVELEGGEQQNQTAEVDGQRSTAEFSTSKIVELGEQQFVVAQLSCTVGKQQMLGAHLIGSVEREIVDLGIIATGSKITTSASGGRLKFSTRYRTQGDEEGQASGTASYEIGMVGNTPVRIFDGESAKDIAPAVEQLPPHGYDAGIVAVNGYGEEESDATWGIGLLDEPEQVLSADSLGGGYEGSCWHSTIYTQAGEELSHSQMAYPDDELATGTVIDLSEASKATPGVRGSVTLPVENEVAGLLIPANGVVPALATLTTQKAGNPLEDPLVTTKAPADAWQDIVRFGALSGSEYPLPFGAFAIDGKIAMTGAWYAAPIDKASAAYGMRPLADPAAMGEKRPCAS